MGFFVKLQTMLFSHKYRYFFVLLLGLYSYLNTVLTGVFDYYPLVSSPEYVITVFVSITLIVWETNRILQEFFKNNFTKKNIFFGRKVHPLLIAFLASFPIALVAGTLPTYLIGTFLLDYSLDNLILPLKLTVAFSLRINLFLHSLNVIAYTEQQYQEKKLETEKLIKTTAQAQLQSLRSQVNPHFLFNNLNVLSALILKDTSNANEFVEKFAKVYRYILKSHEKELVPLEDELAFIKSYCYLLLKRFGKNIQVEIDIPEVYFNLYIIPVALQILVENAVKHNVISQRQRLFIHIYMETDDRIIVSNSLQRKILAENDSSQLGLKNIAQRYELLNRSIIEISENNGFFVVKLPLIALESNLT
jgi:two-component system, LytTR family, sensor kinase